MDTRTKSSITTSIILAVILAFCLSALIQRAMAGEEAKPGMVSRALESVSFAGGWWADAASDGWQWAVGTSAQADEPAVAVPASTPNYDFERSILEDAVRQMYNLKEASFAFAAKNFLEECEGKTKEQFSREVEELVAKRLQTAATLKAVEKCLGEGYFTAANTMLMRVSLDGKYRPENLDAFRNALANTQAALISLADDKGEEALRTMELLFAGNQRNENAFGNFHQLVGRLADRIQQ